MGACPSRARPTTAQLVVRRRSSKELLKVWRKVVTRIVRLLLIRRRWASAGLALQQPELLSVFDGLERNKGILSRLRRGRRTSLPQ